MLRKLLRRIADAVLGPPETKVYDPLDDIHDEWVSPPSPRKPPFDRPVPSPGPSDDAEPEAAKPPPPTDEELIAQGAELSERMTAIHGDGSKPNLGGISMGSHEEIDAALRKGWESALVGFYPHDSSHPFKTTIEKGAFLVDATGTPVAAIEEGPITLHFGARAFLSVRWLTKDPVARRVARLHNAPWISVSPTVEVRRRVDHRGMMRNDTFRDELETQLDLDVASGRLRSEFAEFIRDNIGREPSAYARFFVAYVVGHRRPAQDRDGENVAGEQDENERMSWKDR